MASSEPGIAPRPDRGSARHLRKSRGTAPRFAVSNPQLHFQRSLLAGSEESVRSTSAKIAVHVLVFVAVIVVMSALSIWLGLGPVVWSP
jgi:hypothetical protein